VDPYFKLEERRKKGRGRKTSYPQAGTSSFSPLHDSLGLKWSLEKKKERKKGRRKEGEGGTCNSHPAQTPNF